VNVEPRLEMRGIVKRFAGTLALNRVDFCVQPGEIHALLGQNGAGKSTLIKILAGIYSCDEGTIRFEGKDIVSLSPHESHTLGMRFIHQELNLVPWFSVAENIVLGDVYPRRLRLIDWRTLNAQASRVLDKFGIPISPRSAIQGLSVGKQWLVAIARALYSAGNLLVMDEPTASLSKREVTELLKVVRSLQHNGTSVIYISHRLEEVLDLAHHVTVLRDGARVASCDASDLDIHSLTDHMTGRPAASRSAVSSDSAPAHCPSAGTPPALEFDGVSVSGRVHDVSFAIQRGEITGITGLVGSGKTELGSAAFGLIRHRGTILVNGCTAHLRTPSSAMAQRIAFVPEERRRQGVIPNMTLRENVTLPYLRSFCTRGTAVIKKRAERQLVREMMVSLDIKAAGTEALLSTLSGGNQQKVVLSRWLHKEHVVMVLDEPTRGIDVGARLEVFRLVRRLAREGVGILYISSDIDEIMQVADRVIVLREGRLVADLVRQAASAQEVLDYCYGNLAQRLQTT